MLVPFVDNKALDLAHEAEGWLEALRQLRDGGEEIPYDIDASDGQLLSWAATDNGDVCYWRRDAQLPPDSWTVIVQDSRAPLWEEHAGSAADFLLTIMSGRYRSEIFPDDFPSSETPAFIPLEEYAGEGD